MLFYSAAINAQDLHFSQYQEHPSLLNPALTGASGYIRASASFKDQWKSVTQPYRTMGASLELRRSGRERKKKRVGKFGTALKRNSGKLAAGLSVYKDKAGDGYLGLTQGNLSLASFVPLGKRSFLSLGIQASLAQRRLDPTMLIFPSQYSPTGYDPGLPSNESFAGDRTKYTDYAAGLLWTFGQDEKTFVTHKEVKAKLGFSVYHITEPGRQLLMRSPDQLLRKYVAHADLLFNFNTKTALAPSFLYQMQGISTEMVGGAMFRYYLHNSSKYTGYANRTVLGLGAYYRNADAAIIRMLLEWDERYALGVSFDLNISRLSAASAMRGGLEFTLRFSPAGGFLYEK